MSPNKSNIKKEPEGSAGSFRSFLYLLRHGKLAWWLIILGEAVSLGAGSVALQFTNRMSDLVAGDFSMPTLYRFIWMTALYAVFTGLSNVMMTVAQTKSVQRLRTVLWDRMMHMKLSSKAAKKASEMVSAINADATLSMQYIIMSLIGIPAAVYFVVMAAVQAAQMSTRFLIPIFCLVPVYILYALFVGRWNQRTNHTVRVRIGGLTGFLSERLRSLDLLKAYGAEEEEKRRGAETAEKLYKENVRLRVINTVTTVYILLFDSVSVVMAILFGSSMIRTGTLRPTEWANFFLLLPMVNNMLRSASGMWVNVCGGVGFTSRIAELLKTPEEAGGTKEAPDCGTLLAEHVSFSYDGKEVLHDISLSIPEGKTTAIVGRSGSGKTTILNLLEGFYQPDSGRILYAGTDISEYSLSSYRRRIAYVQQDSGMFSGTIREALLYGIDRQVSDEEIIGALEKVQVYEDIAAFPGGLDARVAIWGGSLSGGQKQKLVIAREILRGTGTILLDEPTASLDISARKAVFFAVREAFRGKTLVTVTHELQMIRDADVIIMVNQGRVLAQGSHEALMEHCSAYRELVLECAYEEEVEGR